MAAVVLIPIVGQFFIALATEYGIYEHLAGIINWIGQLGRDNWIVQLGHDPAYRLVAFAIVLSLVVYLWMDASLRRGKDR